MGVCVRRVQDPSGLGEEAPLQPLRPGSDGAEPPAWGQPLKQSVVGMVSVSDNPSCPGPAPLGVDVLEAGQCSTGDAFSTTDDGMVWLWKLEIYNNCRDTAQMIYLKVQKSHLAKRLIAILLKNALIISRQVTNLHKKTNYNIYIYTNIY